MVCGADLHRSYNGVIRKFEMNVIRLNNSGTPTISLCKHIRSLFGSKTCHYAKIESTLCLAHRLASFTCWAAFALEREHFWLKSYLCFCRVYWMKLMDVAKRVYQYRNHFEVNLSFVRIMNFTEWLWGWNVRVNGILSLFSFCDVCQCWLPINLLGAMMVRLNNTSRIATKHYFSNWSLYDRCFILILDLICEYAWIFQF